MQDFTVADAWDRSFCWHPDPVDRLDGPGRAWNVAVVESLPQEYVPRLREAVESPAWRQSILASAQGITDGTHWLTAMRHQGVKGTLTLLLVGADQRLTEVPEAYPHQRLGTHP